ncbi:unnamed protein product [Calypogeia fissa]
MAQSVVNLSGAYTSAGFGVTGRGTSPFLGEALPCAIPLTRHRYGGEQAFYNEKRRQSRSPPKAYVTEIAANSDHFATLGVSCGASKREIKSAYRRLALQYHPDVCKGDSCTRTFMHITAAYERAMQGLPPLSDDGESSDEYVEGCMGVGDDSWDEWEEWMGWEGAGTRDYSSHVNNQI